MISTYNLEDLEDTREGFEVPHIDKEGRGGGGGDHPMYGDLSGHPAAGGGGGATACLHERKGSSEWCGMGWEGVVFSLSYKQVGG